MIKKTLLYHLISLSLLFTLLFQSCDNNDNEYPDLTKTVSFYISQSSRATDTEFEKGDAIGVYAALRESNKVAPLSESGNYAENKKFIYNGEKFTADGENNTILISSYPIDYYVYYPYTETISNPLQFSFSVKEDQRNDLSESDLMYASNTEGKGENNIPLNFSHKLSKIRVSYDPEAGDGKTLEGATLKKALITGEIDLSTGEIQTGLLKKDVILQKVTDNQKTDLYAIIPAQDWKAQSPFLSLNLGGTSKDFELSSDKKFREGHTTVIPFMGKELQYTFIVNPENISTGYSSSSYNYNITSDKYYSVNGKPLPGTESSLDYTISTTDSWIALDKSTKGIKVAENLNTAPRNGHILFTQAESGRTYTLPVQQSSATTRQTLLINTAPGNIPAAGGTKTVTAVLNTYYNDHQTPDKEENVTVSLSGTGTGFSLSGNQIIASNNTTTNIKSITVKGSYNGISSENNLTITQDAGAKQYASWSDWNVTVSASPTTIASSGGTSAITAAGTRTRSWTWNGVSGSGGTETDKATPALSASGSGFSLSGTTLTAGNNTTTAERSCTVTATSNGKSATCTVKQAAGTISYGEWKVTISASPTTIAAAGGTSTLTYSASRDVLTNGVKTSTETGTPVISGSASGFSLSGRTVSASNNTSTSARSVTYTATHSGKSANCTITQTAGTKQYASWSNWNVTVSANPTTIAKTGGTSVITTAATRTRSWTWNGVSGSGGTETDKATPALSASGSGFSLSGTTLTAGNNTTTAERSCTVTATSNGKSATCTVKQAAGTISYGEWKVTISASPTTIAAAGGTSTLTYSASRDVLTNGVKTSTETGTPVISGSASGFSLSGRTVSASNNTSTSARSVTYTATHSGKSATCTISQSAGSPSTDYSSWSTSSITASASPATVAASGGSSSLSCKAHQVRDKYTKWNGITTSTTSESQDVSVTASWSKVSGSGSLSGSSVTFGNNTSTSSLSGVYRASYSGKTSDVTVYQSAGSVTTTYGSWSTSSLSVNASPTTIAATGGNSTLSATAYQVRDKYTRWNGITTNTSSESQNINVASSASWSGSATGFTRNGTSVSVSSNSNTSQRSCTYTAFYDGKSDYITIYQNAASISEDYYFSLSSGSSTNLVESASGSISYTVSSYKKRTVNRVSSNINVSYSASANVSWITAGNTSSSYQENTAESLRTGTITLTQAVSGKTITIQIRQKGKTIIDIN